MIYVINVLFVVVFFILIAKLISIADLKRQEYKRTNNPESLHKFYRKVGLFFLTLFLMAVGVSVYWIISSK